YPVYLVSTLCIVRGVTGFGRIQSIPSLVAGVGCIIYYMIRHKCVKPIATASAVLLLLLLPCASKDPILAMLTVASASAGAYYGKT
ncbi:hypothetical protein BU17DRAFT_46423, partial [Hysterangium stoloniferum]